MWYDGRDEFTAGIESPTGWHTPWIGLCEQADIEHDGEVVGRIYHRCWDPNNNEHRIDMFLDATAPAGEFHGASSSVGRVDVHFPAVGVIRSHAHQSDWTA